MAISEVQKNQLSLLSCFSGITDPRIERHKRYQLNELLFLSVNAVCCGYTQWDEITDFGEEKLPWLREFLPYENGICSHDTLNRVFGLIDYREFEVFFVSWVAGIAESLGGKLINIDGKKLRSSVDKRLQQTAKKDGGKAALHLVEAWCSELNLCLGQYKTEDKSNEITAIPALLDMLEISGSLISIDAMGCQKTIADKILDKGANYLFGLKGNQEQIHEAVKALFEQADETQIVDTQYESDHGRVEGRHCRVLDASLLSAEIRQEWSGLKTLVEVRTERCRLQVEGDFSEEKRYYISSKSASSAFFNLAVQGHWGIENKLHWVMDVVFGEDDCRKRKGNAAQNFALIQRLVLNLLKNNDQNPKVSIQRKMNKCALSDEYRLKSLRF